MKPTEIVYKDLTVSGGTNVGFVLPAPPRGQIGKFIVTQSTGTLAGFSYCLYNHRDACPPGVGAKTAGVNAVVHQICKSVTVASSSASNLDEAFRLLLPYCNVDARGGSGSSGSSNADHGFVYLLLDVAGSGVKTFDVALTVYVSSE